MFFILLPPDFPEDVSRRSTLVFAFYRCFSAGKFKSPTRGSLRGSAWGLLVDSGPVWFALMRWKPAVVDFWLLEVAAIRLEVSAPFDSRVSGVMVAGFDQPRLVNVFDVMLPACAHNNANQLLCLVCVPRHVALLVH